MPGNSLTCARGTRMRIRRQRRQLCPARAARLSAKRLHRPTGRAPARSTVPASFVSGPGWAHSRAPDSARLRVTAVAPKGWTHGCGKGNTFKQQKIPNGPFSLLAHIIAVSTLTRGLAAGWLNAASARAAASRGAPVAPWKPDPSGEEGGGGEGGVETHEIKSVSRNDRAPTRDHIIN